MEQNFEQEINRLVTSLEEQQASSEITEQSMEIVTESMQQALAEQLDLVWKALEKKVDAAHLAGQMKMMRADAGKKA